MGGLYRSEDMHLIQMFIQSEAVHDSVEELGRLRLVQFVDLNREQNTYQRNYVAEVRRFDEMQRKLRFFETLVRKNNIKTNPNATPPQYGGGYQGSYDNHTARTDALEQQLVTLEQDLLQKNQNQEALDLNFSQAKEVEYLLEEVNQFFMEVPDIPGAGGQPDAEIFENTDDDAPLLRGKKAPSKDVEMVPRPSLFPRAVKLGFLTGLMRRKSIALFERTLWRATRGNMFLRYSDAMRGIPDPVTGVVEDKSFFIVFYQGERLRDKMQRICESFGASLHPVPETKPDRDRMLAEVRQRINDLEATGDNAKKQRVRQLTDVAYRLKAWNEQVATEKAIYETMNKFQNDVTRKALIAEAWCPVWADDKIREALDTGTHKSGSPVPSFFHEKRTKDTPPTFYKTNKFTKGFQGIVDAYGMSRYKEANPGVFTIVTFPFLFGIMFGDVGHGLLLTLFALFLCIWERKLEASNMPEMARTIFGGRYLILLMGLWATYIGLLYNDIFALSLDFFGTNWTRVALPHDNNPIVPGRVYPFGIDPGWSGTSNKLNFYNSIKMKMSIIMGVLQMGFGVVLSLTNHIYYKKYINIYCEFIPQMVFLLALFGYLCTLIIMKWLTHWDFKSPPLLLTVLINMILKVTSPADMVPEKDKMYNGQAGLQQFLVFLLFIAVPWMLVPKLLITRHQMKKRAAAQALLHGAPGPASGAHGHGHGGEGEEAEESHDEHGDFGEVVVHQIIHTIEYVLGTVSNTASYLRLWALSLAHMQLTEVIWEQLLFRMIKMHNAGAIFVGFAVWASATFGILMIMESLSAFLHALRLHWVEFQNKFYFGDGWKFAPFTFDVQTDDS